MSRLLLSAVLVALSASALAGPLPSIVQVPAYVSPPSFDLQELPLSQVVPLIFSEVLRRPFVIGPAVLADARLVSFRFSASDGPLDVFVDNFLAAFGYSVVVKDGVSFVQPVKSAPLAARPPNLIYTYRPRFRSVSYLTRVLRPLFSRGGFANNRVIPVPAGSPKVSTNVPPDSAAGLLEQSSDVLIFSGDQEQVDELKSVLPDVDTPAPQVVARAVVYEVSSSRTTGSGFQLALNLLGGRFGLSLGGPAAATGNYVQIKTGTFDALIQSLDSDSHFKAISSPILRINSGSTGSFNVGDSVPTLGSISYPPNGGPAIQSVTYQQSGIIFTLSPTVFSDDVTLRLDQQISSFIPTSNGVNSSPTLTKRDLRTTVSMRSGQTIVLGGLSVNDVTRAKNGVPFLSSFFDTRSGGKSHQDVLLVLHIETLSPGARDVSASLSPGPILPSVGMLSSFVGLPSS